MYPVKFLCIALLITFTMKSCRHHPGGSDYPHTADVVIYGGTSAAITTAVQVARMGQSVCIVSPDAHLGGMSSSGLGFTDTGDKSVIGGLSREFYHRIFKYYQQPETWKWHKKEDYGNKGQGTPAMDGDLRTMWIFEPHIAEHVFEDFVAEYGIKVFRNEWLDREQGVKLKKGSIASITTLSGQTYLGKIFIDATYEGDLMAAAGISYHVGREARSAYDEEWNGIQVGNLPHGHHFGQMKIDPYVIPGNRSSGVLPRISTRDPGSRGDGDLRVQAYCFRLCLTKHKANRVPFERPEDYDSTQFELLLRIYDAGWKGTFNKFDPIPNLKTDVNNYGPFSFDNIGMNYEYPEASYKRRKEIIREHMTYQKGLLYFISADPRIPQDLQNEMKQWGLARDEFGDNGHWPYQIYVREARRMVGMHVMTENEIMGRRDIRQPIGMGSYTMDSHNVQRYITAEGYVQNEGDIEVPVKKAYKISLGSILPKPEECNNLIVPVAVSSSHIAFGSIRMEPVFMILGQSAGTLAAMALLKDTGIHDVPYPDLRTRLIDDGMVLELMSKPDHPLTQDHLP